MPANQNQQAYDDIYRQLQHQQDQLNNLQHPLEDSYALPYQQQPYLNSMAPQKALTDLYKLYYNDDKKYCGNEYQFLEIYLRKYYENCDIVGLPKTEYLRGLSAMLGGRAHEYYYDTVLPLRDNLNLATRLPYTFKETTKIINDHFKDVERKVIYELE